MDEQTNRNLGTSPPSSGSEQWTKPKPTQKGVSGTETLARQVETAIEESNRSRRLSLLMPRTDFRLLPRSERFWVIGGRPGHFKTQLLWNMALNLALQKRRVLFASLEMTPGEMAMMALARFSRIPLDRIDRANAPEADRVAFSAEEEAAFEDARTKYQSLDFSLRVHGGDSFGRSIADIQASAMRFRYDAVMVDHLGMIGRDSGGSELDALSRSIHWLRGLARGEVAQGYRPFVIATSQLNRDIDKDSGDEPRAPRLSDFRGSARIEHDSDMAMVLRKQAHDGEGPATLDAFVLKNRKGRCPMVIQYEAQGAICHIVERRREDAPPQHWSQREPGEDA